MPENDPYWKLKPGPPTPADEICSCKEANPIVLCYAISENPIRCADCNFEVPAERLRPTPELADEIASWREFYGCFYKLWLDSGEFENWARVQLSDPHSAANERGYMVCAKLSTIRPCYYWWFQDTGADNFKPISQCPKCNGNLIKKFGKSVCESCSIIVAN